MTLSELITALRLLRQDNPEFGDLAVCVQDEDGFPDRGVQVNAVEGLMGAWLILELLP